jgi:glutaredoxin 3
MSDLKARKTATVLAKMRRFQLTGLLVAAVLVVLWLGHAAKEARASGSASAFVQNVIYSHRIAIFSKSYCPYVIPSLSLSLSLSVQLHRSVLNLL